MSISLTLDKNSVDAALKGHISKLVNIPEGAEVTIELTTTRKPVGYSAVVSILEANEKPATPEQETATDEPDNTNPNQADPAVDAGTSLQDELAEGTDKAIEENSDESSSLFD